MRIEDEKLLDLFRGPGFCELCGRYLCPRDAHHCYLKRGCGGGHRLDVAENIIALCRTPCHDFADSKRGTNEKCREIVAKRESRKQGVEITRDEIMLWLWAVIRAPKEGPIPGRPWEPKPIARVAE